MSVQDFENMVNADKPIPYVLGGQQFMAKPPNRLPWKAFTKLLLSMTYEGVDGVAKTEEFYRFVTVKADRERLQKLLDADGEDEDAAVAPAQEVNDVSEVLLEKYTGKKIETEPSS